MLVPNDTVVALACAFQKTSIIGSEPTILSFPRAGNGETDDLQQPHAPQTHCWKAFRTRNELARRAAFGCPRWFEVPQIVGNVHLVD